MSADSKKRLAVAIIDFLNKSVADGTLTADDADSIEVATTCIAESFHVDPKDPAVLADAVGPGQDLLQIYGVYERLRKGAPGGAARGAPATTAAASSRSSPASTPAAAPAGVSEEQKKQAESLKSQGNAAMQKKDYPTAINNYTSALKIDPQNAIYLSNRAAAYSASNQQDKAVSDAQAAVDIDPKYTKAWSRLGLAKFALGDAEGSMNAYAKGIEAEGNGGSEAMKKGFETAKRRLEEGDVTARSASPPSNPFAGAGGAGGMPDLASLAGMFGGGGAGGAGGRGGGGGGMPDFASLMSNPMFSNFANQMMSNPQMMESLMSNPAIRRAAEGLQGGGSGGGMPDLGELMQDPNLAEMAKNLMGGGAGRGAGRGDGSNPPGGYA